MPDDVRNILVIGVEGGSEMLALLYIRVHYYDPPKFTDWIAAPCPSNNSRQQERRNSVGLPTIDASAQQRQHNRLCLCSSCPQNVVHCLLHVLWGLGAPGGRDGMENVFEPTLAQVVGLGSLHTAERKGTSCSRNPITGPDQPFAASPLDGPSDATHLPFEEVRVGRVDQALRALRVGQNVATPDLHHGAVGQARLGEALGI
mmetsp:Transcript_69963/g.146275  ORF Transcript_69963/g.146275 Transcript_69963/m.146275 type:complete len:202 (-) Transcript_69963:943-1548(-)